MSPAVLTTVGLGFFSALILTSALWVVTLRNLFRAALSLGVVLIGVAGVFILLEAEFLAFVQILIYVGAILTLVVFAIMLTARMQAADPGPTTRQPAAAAAASLGLFLLLVAVTQPLASPQAPPAEPVTLAALGQQLVTTLILPFEVISLIFVAAMVGAIALAAPKSSPKASRR